MDQLLLDALLASFSDMIKGKLQLAVDSTGFACSSASHYFIAVLQRNEAKAIMTATRSVRRHVKQTLAIDTRTQLILAARYRYGPSADAPDGIPVLEAASRAVKVGSVVADKGYDSGAIRQYIWYRLKADARIPLRVDSKGEAGRGACTTASRGRSSATPSTVAGPWSNGPLGREEGHEGRCSGREHALPEQGVAPKGSGL